MLAIGEYIPQSEVRPARTLSRRNVQEDAVRSRMFRAGRQPSVRMLPALGQPGNVQAAEGPCPMERIVFLLGGTGVVELEIREIGPRVTQRAIAHASPACFP